MDEEQIVEIDTDGTITVTVKGIKGKKCTDVTKLLEQALGSTTSSTPTEEMYEKPEKIKQKISGSY